MLHPTARTQLGREHEARRAYDALAEANFAALPRDCEWLFCLSLLAEIAAHLRDEERAAMLYGDKERALELPAEAVTV